MKKGLFETTLISQNCLFSDCMNGLICEQIVISARVPTKTCVFCMCALEKGITDCVVNNIYLGELNVTYMIVVCVEMYI